MTVKSIWFGSNVITTRVIFGLVFLNSITNAAWICWYLENVFSISKIFCWTKLSPSICLKSRNIQKQIIDAFDATYYLANHGSLERSVNLVLQGFIQRHIHFRMRIVFSLYFNSFAYIGEKRWKLYVHSNWKQLSTLDSEPLCLGRLPPWTDTWGWLTRLTN